MGLVKCPECQRDAYDKLKACPHCGYPLITDSQNELRINPTDDAVLEESSITEKAKTSGLCLSGFVLGIISYFMPIPFILPAIVVIISGIGLAKFDERKYSYKWPGVVGIIIGIIVIILDIYRTGYLG